MHPNGAVVLAPTAKQVAQCKVQFGGVRIVLNRLDEGVNGLILLFIEQVIKPFEISPWCLAVGDAQLAQVETGGQPTQAKSHGQAQQNPGQVKFHGGSRELQAPLCWADLVA